MEITQEQAKKDLENIMQEFSTVGTGSEKSRAAQLILQTLGVLGRRLDKPGAIKMLYLENPEASKILPPTVREIASRYVNGDLTQEQAREDLQSASAQYEKVFKDMGISPEDSSAILKNF